MERPSYKHNITKKNGYDKDSLWTRRRQAEQLLGSVLCGRLLSILLGEHEGQVVSTESTGGLKLETVA